MFQIRLGSQLVIINPSNRTVRRACRGKSPGIYLSISQIKYQNDPPTKHHKPIPNKLPSHRTQLTLTGNHLISPQSQSDHIYTTPITYYKRRYSTMINFLEGLIKTTHDSITFLEKTVILSTPCAPYINRQNKKYKWTHLITRPPNKT